MNDQYTVSDPQDPYHVTDDTDTGLSARNMVRAFMQGATFNYGDELNSLTHGKIGVDPDKEKAFQKAHGGIDFALKLAGGAVSPILATLAAPEALAGLGGAAALSGVSGALSASGESDGSLKDRAEAGVLGGAGGAALGVAGYGAGKLIGGIAGKVLDRIRPERPVARAIAHLIEPQDVQRMAQLNAQAPGTSSLATASIPPKVNGVRDVPRLLTMTRAMGANPDAARAAEGALVQQNAVIGTAKKAIGAKMDALPDRLQLSPELRKALGKVADVLGGNAPEVPVAPHANPLGLQQSMPFSFGVPQTDMSTAEVRSALSELRDIARKGDVALAQRGSGGVRMGDVKAARNLLQTEVYDQIKDFAPLDVQYGQMSQQGRNNVKLLNAVLDSRRNYAGNEAFSASSGSLGGSLPSGRQGVAMMALDKMLTNKAGAADVVAKYALKPGNAQVVKQLLKFAKVASPRVGASANAGQAALIPGMVGLLTPDENEQP